MHLKYTNILLLFVLVVSSVWLFWKAVPKRQPARMLFILARVFAVGSWLAILSVVILFYASFQSLGNTTDEVLFERNSPNMLYVVAVFNRYGGATVHNTTLVSIRPSGEKLDTKKNTIVFCEDAVRTLGVDWNGDQHLIIRNDRREVYNQL